MQASAEIAVCLALVRVRNARTVAVPLYLEPWGEEYVLDSGATVDVVAQGPADDTLEVEFADDHITVWGWAGSVVTLFREGAELGAGQGKRMLVPPLPHLCPEE